MALPTTLATDIPVGPIPRDGRRMPKGGAGNARYRVGATMGLDLFILRKLNSDKSLLVLACSTVIETTWPEASRSR